MESYRRVMLASLLGPALMIGIGLASLATLQQEIYPFYSWFLFALVPNDRSTYQILIHRVGAMAYDPPRFYNQAEGVVRNPHSIVAYKVIQHLGQACKRGDAEEVQRQRTLLEATLPPDTQYEVIRVHSDPIQQWRERTVAIRESLHFFNSAAAPAR